MDRIQGVSLPRSGHNLVVNHLQKYFASNTVCAGRPKKPGSFFSRKNSDDNNTVGNQRHERFHYCEFYYSCRTYPCLNDENNFQKSHDFELDLPVDPGQKYLIQTRSRLEQMISWFELRLKKKREVDSPDGFREFLCRNQPYLDGFRQKWQDSEIVDRLIVDYDQYLCCPADSLSDVVQFFEPHSKVDRTAIEAIVTDVRTGKDVRTFRYYDDVADIAFAP